MTNVLTVGEIVATTKGSGFLEAQPLIGPFPSGTPAIIIAQVGKLGGPCAILGRVGDDDFGQLNLERLRADGMDVSGFESTQRETTGSAFVRYRQDGLRVFVFNIAKAACGTLPATPHGRTVMDVCTHLYGMGTTLSAPGLAERAMDVISVAEHTGGTLSFDPKLRPEILDTPSLCDALDRVLEKTVSSCPPGTRSFCSPRRRQKPAQWRSFWRAGLATSCSSGWPPEPAISPRKGAPMCRSCRSERLIPPGQATADASSASIGLAPNRAFGETGIEFHGRAHAFGHKHIALGPPWL